MKNLVFILIGCVMLWACSQPKPEAAPAETKPAPVEFGEQKYIDISKQSVQSLAAGDVDAFVSTLSDDDRFNWNYGDSINGKAAISDYWKERRGNVIDTLIISNDVWLTVKANEEPAPGIRTGTWVFGWYTATAKYKATGKSMTQLIHQVQHFNSDGKIDEVTQFLDRALIQAALKK